MLIAADDEAIGKIGIELEPLRLELAVDNWRILAWETRIELDFHVQIGMRLKQPARKLGSTISDIVRACVRPDDLGAPVVRKQPFECCDVPVKLRRIGRPVLLGRRNGFRQSFHMQVDGNIVLGRNIGQQQHHGAIGRRVFVILYRGLRQRKMFDRQLTEADHSLFKQRFRALAKFFPCFRPCVARAISFQNHRIERPAAAQHGELVRVLLYGGQDHLRVPARRIVGPVRLGLDKGLCAIQPLHRAQDQRDRAFRIELINVGVRIDVRKRSRREVCGPRGRGILAEPDRRHRQC